MHASPSSDSGPLARRFTKPRAPTTGCRGAKFCEPVPHFAACRRGGVAGSATRKRDIRRRPEFQGFAIARTAPCPLRARPRLSPSAIWRRRLGFFELVRKGPESPPAAHGRSACGLLSIGRRPCPAKVAAAICRSVPALPAVCHRPDHSRTEAKMRLWRRCWGSCIAPDSPATADRMLLCGTVSQCGRSVPGDAP